MNDQHIVFQGEVQLLRWSDTSTQGATVTFQLADHGDLERFKSMTLAKKGMAGQRLAVVMVEIGDDEQPVAQAPKVRPGELCVMACTFCADPKFWKWTGMPDESAAKELVLGKCGVQSRKELDTNKMAATRFHTLIREPFMTWRVGR